MASSALVTLLVGLCLLVQISRALFFLYSTSSGLACSLRSAILACKWSRSKSDGTRQDQEPDDGLQEEIQKEIGSRRLAYARRGFGLLSAALFAVEAVGLMMEFAGTAYHPGVAARAISLVGLIVITVWAIKPKSLNQRTLNLWHALLMALVIFHASPLIYEQAEHLEKSFPYYQLFAVFCGTLNLNARVTFLTNLALSVTIIFTYTNLPGANDLLFFVSREFIFLVAKVGFLYWTEALMIYSIEHEVKAKSLGCHKSATTSLLQRICDSVVELDGDLNFVQHSSSLAALLFHGPGKCHQGTSMSSLLHSDDDKTLFQESLSACSHQEGAPAAGMIHAQLRGCWGKPVPTELFHVAYPAKDNKVHHIIGIRGQQDDDAIKHSFDKLCETCQQAVRSAAADQMPTEQLATPAEQGPGAEGSGGPQPVRLLDVVVEGMQQPPRPRSRSRSSSRSRTSHRENHVTADIKASGTLPVVSKNKKFLDAYGAVDTFIELVPEQEQEAFKQWVMSTADGVWNSSRPPQMEDFGILKLMARGHTTGAPKKITVYFPRPQAYTDPNGRASYAVSIRISPAVDRDGGGGGTSANAGAQGDLARGREGQRVSTMSSTLVNL